MILEAKGDRGDEQLSFDVNKIDCKNERTQDRHRSSDCVLPKDRDGSLSTFAPHAGFLV